MGGLDRQGGRLDLPQREADARLAEAEDSARTGSRDWRVDRLTHDGTPVRCPLARLLPKWGSDLRRTRGHRLRSARAPACVHTLEAACNEDVSVHPARRDQRDAA